MNKILHVAVVTSWAAMALASPAAAGDSCLHDECGRVCRIYAIHSHRHVPEICYREIKVKVPKKVCETRLVEDKSQVVTLSYQTVVEPCEATISVPHCKLKTCYVPHQECWPETKYKSETIDVGHTASVCQRIGLCKKLHYEVWVPKYVERCVPYTEIAHREVLIPETKVECHERSIPIKFPVEKTVVQLNHQDLVRHVPVTTECWTEEEIVIRVPFASSRCISCRQVFEAGDCSP